MSNPRPIRMVAKRSQTCVTCRQGIVRGECLVVIPGGTPGAVHKRCEADFVVEELDRRERASKRMMGNKFGAKE